MGEDRWWEECTGREGKLNVQGNAQLKVVSLAAESDCGEIDAQWTDLKIGVPALLAGDGASFSGPVGVGA